MVKKLYRSIHHGKNDPPCDYDIGAIIESMDEGIISFDTEGRVTHFNSAASKMLQLTPDCLAGRRLDELMQNSDITEMLLRKGKKINDQEYLGESRGKRLHFLVGGRAIKNNQGDIQGGVLILREIHHVRNLVTRMLGAQARYTFEDIIGSSPAIIDTVKLARHVAGSSVTILLQGESGTGKELFAQAMHNAGPCPRGPFVVINCGAIPKELMESELFGFEDGAFTGARRGGQPGKFELAGGGTIFLDEIAEFPLESQVALLRILQEKVVVRVGGSKLIPVELRVIAATNKDLLKEVNKGNFRQDLYYRLDVITLIVPPLRERENDIIELAHFFASLLGEQIGKVGVIISKEAEKLFLNYSWPGNVRELRNAIERAVNISMSSVIEVDHLPEKIRFDRSKSGFTDKLPATAGAASSAFIPGLMSLEEAEKRIILDTLNHLNGNVTRCAKILGISRNTMYRKMREMNMHMEESLYYDH